MHARAPAQSTQPPAWPCAALLLPPSAPPLTVLDPALRRCPKDLNALVDDHGQLHQMVSRQLSRMSHISVHSECGTVYVTKEEGKAPFTLTGLIGRGGFGAWLPCTLVPRPVVTPARACVVACSSMPHPFCNVTWHAATAGNVYLGTWEGKQVAIKVN